MAVRQSMKYGVVAVVVAVAIILAAIATSPALSPGGKAVSSASASPSVTASTQISPPTGDFAVLLTDPPNVPPGTSQLNLTYSAIKLLATFPNGTSRWASATASGTIDLLSLVNETQTLGTANIPVNSTVSKIQFTIASVSAVVNGQDYPVTTLSDQLLVSIANAGRTNSSSGVLLDLRPTLVQIQATNSTGGSVAYYVLVPSATAIIKSNVSGVQFKVGTRMILGEGDRNKLENFLNLSSKNVTITSATLSVVGNDTQFSITLTNRGDTNATLFGVTLSGMFNSTTSCPRPPSFTTTFTTHTQSGQKQNFTSTFTGHHGGFGKMGCLSLGRNIPQTIPFKINGTSLVPLLGSGNALGFGRPSLFFLAPGESVTLSFSGEIQLGFGRAGFMPSIVLRPISGDTYTVRMLGEGFQTQQVTAT